MDHPTMATSGAAKSAGGKSSEISPKTVRPPLTFRSLDWLIRASSARCTEKMVEAAGVEPASAVRSLTRLRACPGQVARQDKAAPVSCPCYPPRDKGRWQASQLMTPGPQSLTLQGGRLRVLGRSGQCVIRSYHDVPPRLTSHGTHELGTQGLSASQRRNRDAPLVR